ncbi:hypothetical protein EON65_36105 [archaeon]|nr:MAG: hypothetical protein EON65_36105 [archaeon]
MRLLILHCAPCVLNLPQQAATFGLSQHIVASDDLLNLLLTIRFPVAVARMLFGRPTVVKELY